MKPTWRALMDGAGSITLFPDPQRPCGSPDLLKWRLWGMTGMFVLLMLALALTLVLAAAGWPDGWVVLPYLITTGLWVALQIRHGRVPPA